MLVAAMATGMVAGCGSSSDSKSIVVQLSRQKSKLFIMN